MNKKEIAKIQNDYGRSRGFKIVNFGPEFIFITHRDTGHTIYCSGDNKNTPDKISCSLFKLPDYK